MVRVESIVIIIIAVTLFVLVWLRIRNRQARTSLLPGLLPAAAVGIPAGPADPFAAGVNVPLDASAYNAAALLDTMPTNLGGLVDAQGNFAATTIDTNLGSVPTAAIPVPLVAPGTNPNAPYGMQWNWPLVIIVILIALFLIWLIGYTFVNATGGRRPTIQRTPGAPPAAIAFGTTSATPSTGTSLLFPTTSGVVGLSTTAFTAPPAVPGVNTGTVATSTFGTSTGGAFAPPPPAPPTVSPPVIAATPISTSTVDNNLPISTTTTRIITTPFLPAGTIAPTPRVGATLDAQGTAEVDVTPDQIHIAMQITAHALSDLEAQDALNGTLSDLRGALHALGIAPSDVSMQSTEVGPAYATNVLNLLSMTRLDTSTLANTSAIQLPPPSVSAAPAMTHRRKHRRRHDSCDEDADYGTSQSDHEEMENYYRQQQYLRMAAQTQQQPLNPYAITPTSSMAQASVMIQTRIQPLLITPLLDTVGQFTPQFRVLFSVSTAALQRLQDMVLLHARQRATDEAFERASGQNQQLGAMVSEREVLPTDFEIAPIVITNPRQIQGILNGTNTERVKVRVTVYKTFAVTENASEPAAVNGTNSASTARTVNANGNNNSNNNPMSEIANPGTNTTPFTAFQPTMTM